MFPIVTSRNRLMNTFVIVFPYRQSIDRNLNILIMVNINLIKETLDDKQSTFTHFYLCKRKIET